MIDPAVIRSIHESRLALLHGPPFHGRDIHELMNTTSSTRVRNYYFFVKPQKIIWNLISLVELFIF